MNKIIHDAILKICTFNFYDDKIFLAFESYDDKTEKPCLITIHIEKILDIQESEKNSFKHLFSNAGSIDDVYIEKGQLESMIKIECVDIVGEPHFTCSCSIKARIINVNQYPEM